MGLLGDPVVNMGASLGFLFPGQGAQYVGMGKDVAEKYPSACSVYERANAILGYDLSRICWEGPQEVLTQTLHAQPGIFVTSLAVLEVIRQEHPDLQPSLAAGLSLGEFTALVAAGAMSFEDGLRLVQIRARAMAECAGKYPGTMASILGLAAEDCEEIAQETGCEVANLNAPDQTVLSGRKEAVEKACSRATARGAKRAVMLNVGGAFHSSLMQEAEEELRRALEKTPIAEPHCLFVANAVGERVQSPAQIKELLARQLTSPVRWSQTMEVVRMASLELLLELGPGNVLRGLARKNKVGPSVMCIGTVEEIEKFRWPVTQAE